jgi:hypothetical protein
MSSPVAPSIEARAPVDPEDPSSGAVKCWGRNDRGQLGDNSAIESHVPVDVVGF